MILQPRQAPAIVGMMPKSQRGPGAEDRAIRLACRAARGVAVPIPVLFDNRVLGYVKGIPGSNDVLLAVGGLDQFINNITTNGQRYTSMFMRVSGQSETASSWYDHYPLGPGGGTYTGAAFTSRQFTDITAGAIPHGGNVSPATKHLATGWALAQNATNGFVILVYDRVLTYEACTLTGALQNMTNSLAAQRYISAEQPGLQVMPTVQVAFGSANLTALIYVNQAGTAGHAIQTGTTMTFDAGAAAPTTAIPAQVALQYAADVNGDVLFLPLANGDTGVRSITSYTTSAAVAGQVCFVLVHPIAYITTPAAGLAGQYDFVRQTANLERIYDGACLSFLVNNSQANNISVVGALDFMWS